MERDAAPALDHRLARALTHPTRGAILRQLIGRPGLTLGSLSEKLGVKVANVRYHVDVLASCGAIEAVRSGGAPGELLVRLAPLAGEREERPAKVSDGLREDVSEAQLRTLIEIAGDLETGYDGRGA